MVGKTFSGCVVVGTDEGIKAVCAQGGEGGVARDGSPHATKGIFNAALLPRLMGVAKEGLNGQGMQLVVLDELGAIIEGQGLAQAWGKGLRSWTISRAMG